MNIPTRYSLLTLVLTSSAACTSADCPPGQGMTAGGECARINYGDDDSPGTGDSADTSGDTAPQPATCSTDELISIYTEGGFAGYDVLGIGVDTLRDDAIGAFGSHPMLAGRSPNMDTWLANNTVIIENTVTGAAWTAPSAPSYLAGVPAVECGEDCFVRGNERNGPNLPTSYTMLQEALQETGYSTYLSTGNSFMGGDDTGTQYGWNTIDVYNDKSVHPGETYDDAVDRLASVVVASEGPSFHQLFVMEPHASFIAPPEYLDSEHYACEELPSLPNGIAMDDERVMQNITNGWTTFSSDQQDAIMANLWCYYGAEVQWTDAGIGRLLSALDGAGKLEHTLVVFMGDHGEEFGEHDDLFGHQKSLHGAGTNVIGGFYSPCLEPDTHVGMVDIGDLGPTVLRALGEPIPDTMTGVPLGDRTEDDTLIAYQCGSDYDSQQARSSVTATNPVTGQRLYYDRDTQGLTLLNAAADPYGLDGQEVERVDAPEDLLEAVENTIDRSASESWCGGG